MVLPRRSRTLLGAVVVTLAACGGASRPKAPARVTTPACPAGPFAAEIERLLPSLSPPKPVALYPAEGLDPSLEPGCVVPFRKQPDERLLDVGLVVVQTHQIGSTSPPVVVGRGRLEVGRRALRLRATDPSGVEALALTIDGSHVVLDELGKNRFEADVSVDGAGPLPLPLDALVAGLDTCKADERLGRTEDGDVVQARRGSVPLWRTRWIANDASAIVDTSTGCSEADARLVWRSGFGDLLPMFAVASVRSERTLLLVRQAPSGAAVPPG
jgi:hypothetical protein